MFSSTSPVIRDRRTVAQRFGAARNRPLCRALLGVGVRFIKMGFCWVLMVFFKVFLGSSPCATCVSSYEISSERLALFGAGLGFGVGGSQHVQANTVSVA